MNDIKISIITPTYNRKEMLEQAIESVRKQSYNNFEIIIIDDCSTDGTDKFIQKYVNDNRIRYFRNDCNMGPGYNRNFGYCKSDGQYIIFLDDDDYYTDSDFFNKAIDVFKYKNPDHNLSFVAANASNYYIETGTVEKTYIGIKGRVTGLDFLMGLEVIYQKPLSTFSTIFSRKILEKADFLNMEMVNDYAIYIRALLYGDAYILPDYIGMYRKHSGNISLNIKRDFLMQNFEERKWAKERLYNKLTENKIKKWWTVQMMLLYKYYLTKTKPSTEDLLFVVKWIIRNSTNKAELIARIIMRTVIIKAKDFLGIGRIKKYKVPNDEE